MKKTNQIANSVLLFWGVIIVLLGLTANEWTLAAVCFPGASVDALPMQFRWMARFVVVFGVFWGVITIIFCRQSLIKKLNLSAFSLLILAPLCGESAIRFLIASKSSEVRKPELYANWYNDDDFWKLHLRWVGKWKPDPNCIHPLLGWTQTSVTSSNQMGLKPATHNRLVRDERRKILFYGDSFVAGIAPPEDTIPAHMGRQLKDADVLDLGVGGFGTGQTFLMFRETHTKVERPFVIIGVLTYNLDRAVLSVRTARKPRFVVDGQNDLQLTGVPVPTDQEEFFNSAPLDSKSFLFSMMKTRIRKSGPAGYDLRREEKQQVNAALIDETQRICQREELDFIYVLFYSNWALQHPDWREEFFKREFERRKIDYVDTREALLAHCRETATEIDTLYVEDGGHHNAAGNHVIGDAVVAHLRKRSYVDTLADDRRVRTAKKQIWQSTLN